MEVMNAKTAVGKAEPVERRGLKSGGNLLEYRGLKSRQDWVERNNFKAPLNLSRRG